jgi:hypothetical protein
MARPALRRAGDAKQLILGLNEGSVFQMDGTNNRLTAPHVLPFNSSGDGGRRICAVFAMADGAVLALQASGVQGDAAKVTLLASLRPAGGEWTAPALVAADVAAPSGPSLTLAPVLLRDGADFAVAWPCDATGLLVVTPGGVEVVDCPGRITALCAQGDDLFAAVAMAGETAFLVRRAGQGFQPFAPSLPGVEVTALAFFADHLHAAGASARAGFDLWRSAGGDWTPVMTRGAWRYGSSPQVTAMAVDGERLYVAADGPDIRHVRVGDEHPEILAVDPQGNWQLWSGQARFSPDGLRLPVTAGGPGVPACCGLSVGGFQRQGDGLLVWLKPRPAGPNLLSVMSLTGAGWAPLARIGLDGMAVTTLAAASDGTIFVGAGGNGAATTGAKPLMVAFAPL